MLLPPRSLERGEFRVAAGLSGHVAAGDLGTALGDARDASADANDSHAAAARARATVVSAAIGPGVAPVVAARVGVGSNSDTGVAYSGRAVRVDMRHSLNFDAHWSLSAGVGGSAVIGGHDPIDADTDLSRLQGGGADIPVVVGYESDGGLYAAWLGARAGWEQVFAGNVRSEPLAGQVSGPALSVSAGRTWAGGLLGVAVGFRHVHVAMELDVAYAKVFGDVSSTHVDLAGVTVCPASAVSWQF